MKITILCLLLVPFVRGASIQQSNLPSIEPATTVQPIQPAQPLGRSKRFLFYDDDFDDFLRRRRPSRQAIRLAQMIEDLSGPGGFNQAQLQNMLRNLQNLQTMANMQQMMQLLNSQAQPIAPIASQPPNVTG